MKLVCVATAPSGPIGESWAELLRNQGVPAFVRPDTPRSHFGSGLLPARVMVAQEREHDALVILGEFLQPTEDMDSANGPWQGSP